VLAAGCVFRARPPTPLCVGTNGVEAEVDVSTVDSPKAVRPTAVPMMLAVTASVLGTVVASAFEASPSMRLFGAALGAAIPPLISVAGPFAGLRAATGVLVAAGALFVTYSGFTVADYATNQEQSTFPLPPRLPPTSPTPTPSVTTPTPSDTAGTAVTCEGELCISVTPMVLHCSSDGCDNDVTVQSTGSEVLVITTIEFDGPAAGSFSQDGDCENPELHRELREGEECSITVLFTPGEARDARLVIHQNLQGPPTIVALEGEIDLSKPAETCEGELCISTPTVLHCSSDGCDNDVTVQSTGSAPLRITTIDFEGPAAGSFSQDGNCENRELQANEECSITVHYTPGEVGLAFLVIHQNLQGPPTFVALEGDFDTPPPDDPVTPDAGATETPL
jgi:hypothetical protein